MQYAGDLVGLVIWVGIILISFIYRAVKASGGRTAMPPKQGNMPLPSRQNQGERRNPHGNVPPVASHRAQAKQHEVEQVRQALLNELKRQRELAGYEETIDVPVVAPVDAPVEVRIQEAEKPHDATVPAKRKRQYISRFGDGKEETQEDASAIPRLATEYALQRSRRLREAYMLTELIGRPRAYDI